MGVVNTKHIKTLFKRCKGVCTICGRPMSLNNPRAINSYMTVDHIVPLSLGGTNNIENLRGVCMACNRERKSDMTGISYKLSEDFHYIGRWENKPCVKIKR